MAMAIEVSEMKNPANEQETIISFGRNDDRAEIYTSDATMITKLHKLHSKNSTDWKLEHIGKVDGEAVDETWSCPKALISLRTKKIERVLTDEQREAYADRMRSIRGVRA